MYANSRNINAHVALNCSKLIKITRSKKPTNFSSFCMFLVISTFFLLTVFTATMVPLKVPTQVKNCLWSVSPCDPRDSWLVALIKELL
jgi:hypothetical protein